MKTRRILTIRILPMLCLFFALTATTFAQTTEFTYQGRLLDNTMPPTANYDFEFRLFSTDTGGTAIGTVQRLGTAVSNGIFTVKLDFGSQFTGAVRYLEIAVRTAGSSGSFQQLLPRQPLTSAPYSVRSLNAANADAATTANNALQLGGAAANQFVQTSDSRLSDARNPLAGSANYIQNRSTTQTATNFNIDGTGRADIFNAATQYNLGGTRVLIVDDTNNIFAGAFAGNNNTTGSENSFFGRGAGLTNTTGKYNSFVGYRSGNSNISGYYNTFIGYQAGNNNTTGDENTFVGDQTGSSNTSGGFNVAVGTNSGSSNTTGTFNSFVGGSSGSNNTTGNDNVFMGGGSGFNNKTGSLNTFIGRRAGSNNMSGNGNVFFGYLAGSGNTTGGNNIFIGDNAGVNNTSGDSNTIIGSGANVNPGNLNYATAIGAGAVVASSNTIYMGRVDGSDTVRIPGAMVLGTLGSAGSTALCRNASNFIATCSSSLRYKTNVETFTGGLDVVRRLRPITFDWKEGGMHDVGFAAEEVNQAVPLLTTINADGEIEGVKYAQISTVLVNAVKEQQTQIETQQKQIDEQRKQLESQQTQIEVLKKFVCQTASQNAMCREQR